ncbi:GNAT family N-acetyltransferase [Acetobacter conturbans]|uniref:N-acetyltransferase n=1 Tax=Acetobacter conturbans TaxID=1737472 RepID=A0ABX0K2Y1_9PROT|nr:GNAT family N-acetyltransferase [Acetobacter conturbans]NHN89038.1 N-acetyltransferase [Acetobacter conturbans]
MQIRDNQTAYRLETGMDGHIASLDYVLEGHTLVILHTDVPDALGGRGIGSALVRHACDMARAAGLTVASRCSFATEWIKKHDGKN